MWNILLPFKDKGGTHRNWGRHAGKYGAVTGAQKEALIQNIFMLLVAK